MEKAEEKSYKFVFNKLYFRQFLSLRLYLVYVYITKYVHKWAPLYSVYKCTPDELRSSVSLALPVLHGAVQIQGGCGARDVNLLIGILSETNFAKLSLRS